MSETLSSGEASWMDHTFPLDLNLWGKPANTSTLNYLCFVSLFIAYEPPGRESRSLTCFSRHVPVLFQRPSAQVSCIWTSGVSSAARPGVWLLLPLWYTNCWAFSYRPTLQSSGSLFSGFWNACGTVSAALPPSPARAPGGQPHRCPAGKTPTLESVFYFVRLGHRRRESTSSELWREGRKQVSVLGEVVPGWAGDRGNVAGSHRRNWGWCTFPLHPLPRSYVTSPGLNSLIWNSR